MEIKYSTVGCECVLRDGFARVDTVYENHCHPLYEIIMVICGKAAINIENRRFNLLPGAVAFVRPTEYHSVFSLDEAEYKRVTVLFDDRLIPEGIRADFLKKIRISPVSYHDDLPMIISRLERTLAENNGERYSALAEALITQIFYIVSYAKTSGGEEDSDQKLRKIIDYIEENITGKLRLEDIAAVSFLSKSTVCHLFKSRMKTPLKQYVLQKKIAYAAKCIQGGMSAIEASKLIGYGNYASFYKIYRKFLAEPPSEFKGKKQTERS